MAVPTVSTVTPGEGHTGGRTLVEVVGTNFKLPNAPALTGKTTPPPASVRVQFGGRDATNVKVFSATLLYCQTPEQDESLPSIAFTTDASGDLLLATAHGLETDTPVRLFATAGELPTGLEIDTVYYVVNPNADDLQLSLTVGGSAVAVDAAGAGALVYIGSYDVRVDNLDDDGVPIAGENATKTKCFTFRRPDLSEESELARVVRTFLQSLKRQLTPNVAWTTHTDYDPETGDQLNITTLASLPGLILTNMELPEDRVHAVNQEQEFDAGTGRFVQRRAPVVVDMKAVLVGVSDNQVELLNLYQATRTYFKKNAWLYLDRDENDPSLGKIRYEMDFSIVSGVSTTMQGDNTNIGSFAGTIEIRGILLEDMPGITKAKVPDIPSSMPHEATTDFGHVADAVIVEAQTEPES